MVIELSEVQFGLKSHKYDFRPKLHDPKFNYHFIRSILKSHNFMALNVLNIPSRANSGTGNAFTSYLVCKTMSCNENSLKHNKQTRRSENENSLLTGSQRGGKKIRRASEWESERRDSASEACSQAISFSPTRVANLKRDVTSFTKIPVRPRIN